MNQVCKRQSSVGLVFAAILAALVAGCSQEQAATPEERVTTRAQERLAALMAGDFAGALEYTTPTFRQSSSASAYRSRYGGVGNWTEATVEQVSCEPESCNVRVLVSYQMVRPRMENTRPLDEVWILAEGEWYIYER